MAKRTLAKYKTFRLLWGGLTKKTRTWLGRGTECGPNCRHRCSWVKVRE